MSADLFKQEGRSLLSTFTPVDIPEPGVWDGYLRGTGMSLLRNVVKVARSVDMLRAVGPIAQDALGIGVERGGTTVQDMFFRVHDERYNSAVDLLTPRPGEVGAAAEITGSLLTLLPMVVASPAFAVGSSALMTGEDLVREGVRGKEAAVAVPLMGAGLATGIWMPILGQNLWQRMLIGGAAANVAQGAATRGAIGTFLESGDATEAEKKAAQGFKAFDLVELTTDVLLGLAFGSFVHLNPRARAEGAEAWKRIGDWAQALNPSDKAAVAVLREAQHLNKDSFPGTPVGAEDVNAHVERMRRAIDQAERGQPIAVDDLPAPRAEPDTQRNAEAEARMAEMLVEAEAIRQAEGLPPPPVPDVPPARPVLERTPEGAPRLMTDRVVIDEPRPFHVEQGVTYYEATVRSPEGGPLGVVALGWRGDEVVELLNIQAIERNQGMGSAVLSGILRHNAPDTEVWIRLIQPEARGFWEKMGARLIETEEGTDGILTKAEFDTARANRGTAQAPGRAGAADEGTGQRAQAAAQGRPQDVALARASEEQVDAIYKEMAADEPLVDALERWMADGVEPSPEQTTRILSYIERLPETKTKSAGGWMNDFQRGQPRGAKPQERGWMSWTTNPDTLRNFTAGDSEVLNRSSGQGIDLERLGLWRTRITGQRHEYGTQGEWLLVNQPAEPPRTRIEVPDDLTTADPETQARAIGQSIEDRLLELGVDAEEARANGAIWEAFFRTLSQKYGVNPGETLASYGIDIRRLDTLDDLPGALAQAATPNSKVVDEQGRPLVVYHGTSLKNLQGILKKGLVPKRKKNHKESGDYVYVELSAKSARAWARQAGGTEFAVLEIEVPKSQLVRDSQTLSRTSFRTQRIPARLIKGWDVYRIDPMTGDLEYVRSESNPAFRPEQIKSATGNAGTFDPANPSILRQTATPSQSWYYSALGQAIEKANMGAAPAKGWKDFLKGLTQKGVKPDEIRWSGIEEWLDLQQGRITKDQVQEFLRNNGVRVEEVVLGGEAQIRLRAAEQTLVEYLVAEHDFSGIGARDYALDAARGELTPTQISYQDDTMRALTQMLQEAYAERNANPTPPTKFDQYQLPGALPGTYRELLLTLPPDGGARPANEQAYAERVQEIVRARDTGAITNDEAETQFAEARRENGINEFGRSAEVFRSSHFDTPNILAHVRFNERTDADGQRVLFLEEIQSDWAQLGRKDGYRNSLPQGWTIEQVNNGPVRFGARDYLVLRTPEGEEASVAALGKWDELADVAAVRSGASAPPAPFVSRRQFAVYKDNEEFQITKTDQAGKTTERTQRYPTRKAAQEAADKVGGEVRDLGYAPDTEAWVALVLKRMIRYAAENGISRIAWTRGEQQVDRYTKALRSQVDTIEWTKTEKGVQLVGYKGGKPPLPMPIVDQRRGEPVYGTAGMEYVVSHNPGFPWRWDGPGGIGGGGFDTAHQAIEAAQRHMARQGKKEVVDTTEREDALSDSIGKALAKQILDDPNQSGTITGDNIRIDDTGMAQFYDRIVPNVAKDVLKKLGGGKLTEAAFGKTEGAPFDRAEVERAAVEYMQGRASPEELQEAAGSIEISAADLDGIDVTRGITAAMRRQIARDFSTMLAERAKGQKPSTQPAIDLTPEMLDKALQGQTLFQQATPYTQPERGVIHFGNGQTMIGLMATANRSTFLHESGHLFLQITRDVVQNPEIPAQARADWDRLSAWLGIEPDTATIPVEAHEKFARGFEAYLREGKAPNQGLQDVFRRFRDWLLDIYHSLADLRVELSDDVRGIMARMLDSQARDPINAKGPAESAPRVSPPPPPGEGGEATPRPEAPPTPEGARTPGALEGPDPWELEGSIPAQGPDVPFEPVGLDNPDMRTMLQIMADEEAGWLEIGGRLDRSRLADPEKLGTPAFTKWVPKADWWPKREGKLNEAQTREAVRRALAGEKLTKKQQAAIDYMMDVANQRLHAEKVLGSDEFGAIARDLVDEGMDPTTQDITEVAMIARAAEIDEARVERAAMIHEGNHDAFLEEIRTILDEAAEREAGAPPAEPAGRPGQEGAGAQGREGGEGEGRPDPVAAAAQRFVDQNPGRTIQVVDDAGNTRTMTAAEYLQMARAEAERAREDVGLFQAAAECLLGGGR